MSINITFYLYAKNKDNNKYENISWRTKNNKIIPMLTGTSIYCPLIRKSFKTLEESEKENFCLDEPESQYMFKELKNIFYKKPKRKIMYIHYDYTDMVENDEVNEEDLFNILLEENSHKFPIIIDQRLYGQLLPKNKQNYIPVIMNSDYMRYDILAMNISKICKAWINEFQWIDNNYKKYDFDNALIVAKGYC